MWNQLWRRVQHFGDCRINGLGFLHWYSAWLLITGSYTVNFNVRYHVAAARSDWLTWFYLADFEAERGGNCSVSSFYIARVWKERIAKLVNKIEKWGK